MSLANQKKNKQQNELLHSVLPGFIVNQMIQEGLRLNGTKSFFDGFQSLQFHKAKVHHYEQVSILFADIKGFMGKLLQTICKYIIKIKIFSNSNRHHTLGTIDVAIVQNSCPPDLNLLLLNWFGRD